ncbi:hypothetical protein CWI37_1108p0010 [Hamiltosporidium tvaerminnensis]|uniref:Uncharacterized protein n=2 Tax=Hamiltosporidium TaxID=1176354 RepID=A0A4Q9L5M7_9MICR|nr:hypothetical protein CWI37_1108p0010 [Hamiltosporidium tvaerminnensis]TBU02151.1 hypothetical protein CWI36_1175p0010 [Hamiltosporidium magnivora]
MKKALCFIFSIASALCLKYGSSDKTSNLKENFEDIPNGRSQLYGGFYGLGPKALVSPFDHLGPYAAGGYSRTGIGLP